MVGRAVALAAVAAAAFPVAAQAESWNKLVRSYDGLRIPRVYTTVNDAAKSPGVILTTPRAKPGQRTGPTILDADGRVLWFHRLSRTRTAIGLQAQTYRGHPVLTWGQRPPIREEGDLYRGSRHSVYNVIADESYRIIKRIRARGMMTDLHEFTITGRDTALVLGIRLLTRNLSRYGGRERAPLFDNVIQEIDIRTGRVRWAWSTMRHLSPERSYIRPPLDGTAWDPYHVNAVTEDTDGNYLVTMRHMSAVYKVHRRTGKILWKLGGRGSTFRMTGAARFYYPHDARRAADGSLTVFDNRGTTFDRRRGGSRAINIRVDGRTRRATVAQGASHPKAGTLAVSQGGTSLLPGGNMFVGWGSSPWFSEHAPDGRALFAAHFHSPWNHTYRAIKTSWTGRPRTKPAIRPIVANGRLIVYAAWNGATEIASWRVLGGPNPSSLTELGTVAWADFETRMTFLGTPAAVQVEALDAAGNVLGRSLPLEPEQS
jgi:hypothetical protein